ncbi:oligoribonuclease, mitochondrial-like [Callospermophilus lateralis]|uniref:oligoribonuclease, mitochondrial-like n=1 Tax=Callospermophilus lateralis TaxID=76772 RepID=UPI004038CFB7
MLGGSVGSRLLRGVGGSRRQFGSRGVRGGGAAMAAGDSMAQRMVWVDLEMTGLDIEKDHIIEMACLITDSDLNILAEGPNLIIKQPDELLDSMSDWCKEHHGKSGFTKAVKESTITLQQAEYEFLSFVRQQTPPGLCPLAVSMSEVEMRGNAWINVSPVHQEEEGKLEAVGTASYLRDGPEGITFFLIREQLYNS